MALGDLVQHWPADCSNAQITAGFGLENTDGSGITPVLQNNNAHNWFPQWSTDGKRMFFSYTPSAGWATVWPNCWGRYHTFFSAV